MKKIISLIGLLCIYIPSVVLAEKPIDAVYLEGNNSKSALILAHGKGKHPTWLVVDPLRKSVHEQLGFHTLSLQMPTGHDFWEDYADDFPKAYVTINEAIAFLKKEKGVTRIFLMGHSMGSRMASAYVSQHPQYSLSGLIIAGCRNNGARPLSCDDNVKAIQLPVLDIWGGGSGKDHDAAADRSNFVSSQYQQIEIEGADHRFEGDETKFVNAVIRWLQKQK